MAYPSAITSFTNPQATDRLNAPSHSAIEQAQNTGLTQIQTFLGVEGAASTLGTLIYDVRSPGSDGGGHTQSAVRGGTGQTTYNKGDVLIAQSASVLTKLAVGSDNAVLQADSTQSTGIKWGAVPGAPTLRIFSVANGSTGASVVALWNKPSVLSYIIVEVVGGGGGGALTGGNGVDASGGAGAYAKKLITASTLSGTSSVQVMVGGLGAGGSTNANGSVAGRSYFNTLSSISAAGGGPGVHIGSGGAGGVPSGGDINITGQTGSPANGLAGLGIVYGASNPLGQGGPGNGTGYGASGAGNGSAGSPGIVLVYEY